MNRLSKISFLFLALFCHASCAYQAPETHSPKPMPDHFPPLGPGRTWVLTGFGQGDEVNVTIKFTDNSNAVGQSYCNTYSTRLTTYDNGEIQFGAIMSTKKNCEYIEFESKYFELLSSVDSYEITGNQLILNWSTGGERGRLVFYPERQSAS